MKKVISLYLLLLLSTLSFAQNSNDAIEMADALHSSGKIYLVVAVLLIIFAGIVIFLVRIDKKVSKLEKKLKEKNAY